MSKRTLMRLAGVLGVCLFCAFFFWPLSKVRLGLDLKGGVHYELEVQGHEALERDLEENRDRIVEAIKSKGLTQASVRMQGGSLQISGIGKGDFEDLKGKTGGYTGSWSDQQGRLTQGAVLQSMIKDSANKRALQIIDNRINQFGVVEPEITAGGPEGNRIIVELPGVSEGDRERIKALLSTPGRLELRMLAKVDSPYFMSERDALDAFGGKLPEGTALFPEPAQELKSPGRPRQVPVHEGAPTPIRRWVLLEEKVQFDGSAITDARKSQNDFGHNEVDFTLNQQGAEANARVTEVASREGRMFAFLLDRKVVSVLSAKEKIIGNAVRISGQFSSEEADDLAMKLRSGALRAGMKILEERVVGPSLGLDSIRLGVGASLLGFGVIVLFMVAWYRWSGVNAIVALTVNVIVMMGLLGSFRATLTLPGIAGFALTVGMAVDANILIFERIKEELALGKAARAAIRAGFDRVFWTIVDSHVTQLFAALLLFVFGTGPVKGFAVSLTVGVVASLFTSIYISRYIYDWVLERRPNATTISIGNFKFFDHASFDFMKYKRLAIALSWGVILACVAIAKPWKIHGNERIKLGMQFVGGTDMTVRFLERKDVGAVRAALDHAGIQEASVVAYEHADQNISEFAVKVKTQSHGDPVTQSERIRTALKALDAEDTRLPLNLEGSNALAARLAESNSLHLQGDEQEVRERYAKLASKVTTERERLPTGMYESFADLPQDLPSEVRRQIEQDYRPGKIGVLKDETFSPSISGEWTQKTLSAVAWAMGAILVYVVFRFTTSFAMGGIIALIHDMLMALALFAVMGYEFNVPVVASFLTLMGYSMADTIVVFDRIRENSHRPEYRGKPFNRIINDSINQTLSRTILTSMSVLFVSACLWLWGGPALRDLAFPLVVGVITGTYSSIYIASPVVEWWQRTFDSKEVLTRS